MFFGFALGGNVASNPNESFHLPVVVTQGSRVHIQASDCAFETTEPETEPAGFAGSAKFVSALRPRFIVKEALPVAATHSFCCERHHGSKGAVEPGD